MLHQDKHPWRWWRQRCGSEHEAESRLNGSAWCKILGFTAAWWTSAVFITVLIKSALGSEGSKNGFPYPFALSGLVNLTTALVTLVLSCILRHASDPVPPLMCGETLRLCMIGAIQGVEIGLNNKSLSYLSMSARTMINAMNVIFQMATAWLWGLESLDCMRVIAAVMVCSGGVLQAVRFGGTSEGSREELHDPKHRSMMSTADPYGSDPYADPYLRGVGIQVASMFMASHRWALVQVVTQYYGKGTALGQMSKLHLSARILPITGVVCLSLAALFESQDIDLTLLKCQGLWLKIYAVAMGIAVLTVAELKLVQITSAVAMQMLSALHQIPLVLAGVIIFEDTVTRCAAGGFGLCVLGALCYVRARLAERSSGLPQGASRTHLPVKFEESPGKLDPKRAFGVMDVRRASSLRDEDSATEPVSAACNPATVYGAEEELISRI